MVRRHPRRRPRRAPRRHSRRRRRVAGAATTSHCPEEKETIRPDYSWPYATSLLPIVMPATHIALLFTWAALPRCHHPASASTALLHRSHLPREGDGPVVRGLTAEAAVPGARATLRPRPAVFRIGGVDGTRLQPDDAVGVIALVRSEDGSHGLARL